MAQTKNQPPLLVSWSHSWRLSLISPVTIDKINKLLGESAANKLRTYIMRKDCYRLQLHECTDMTNCDIHRAPAKHGCVTMIFSSAVVNIHFVAFMNGKHPAHSGISSHSDRPSTSTLTVRV